MLKRGLQRGSSFLPTAALRRVAGPSLVAPCYHLVHEQEPPHLRHLFAARRPEVFAADLELFCRSFHPISLHDLAQSVSGGSPLPPRAALITFDDGLRDFIDVAAPMLEAKGVPAACFVNSAFVDNRELSFRSKTSLLMSRLEEELEPSSSVLEALGEILDCPRAPQRQLSAALFSLPYSERRKLDEAAAVLEVDFADFLRHKRPYMTAAELRQLAARGFGLGAHGVDHAPFAELDLDAQLEQTRRCCEELRSTLNIDCTAFAFPFSDREVSLDYFSRARLEAGVELFFGTDYLREDCVPGSFQRIPWDERTRPARELLNWILTKKVFRRALGRDRIRRPQHSS